MRLLVSIHDVTPAWTSEVLALWELCRRYGVSPALFVVPNWHGKWPLEKHPGFAGWLHSSVDNGAEILLHGERHDEVGSVRQWRDGFRAFGKTSNEGEFLTLDTSEATDRLSRGLRLLRTLELKPVGFVPPAWLARESTLDAAASLGLHVSEDASSVRILSRNERIASAAVRWSSRTNFRARASSVIAKARWELQRNNPLVRLALHPQDLNHPITAASLHHEVDRWLTRNHVVRYDSL